MKSTNLYAAVLAATLALAGCRDAGQAEPASTADADAVEATTMVDRVTRGIREEIAAETFTLKAPAGAPRGELTPDGRLLIDGVEVSMDAGQRALAMSYRSEIARVAEEGARLGLQGAEIAKEAMSAAVGNVFSDGGQSVEERLQPATDRIKAQAKALCDSLPQLMAAQDAFARAVPEFAPYADMVQTDIDECENHE